MAFLFGGGKVKTFKPIKKIPEGTHQHTLQQKMMKTLGSGNLALAVKLPEGEDLNEWIAVNTVDFFNQLSIIYDTISPWCTDKSCPEMNAGDKYKYLWADGVVYKKPRKCTAPEYMDFMMTWVTKCLDDTEIFPTQIGVPFPKNFLDVCKKILKRLFRVFAHIYHVHWEQVCKLEYEKHVNTSFKHFALFTHEFNLIEKKELAPVLELYEGALEGQGLFDAAKK